MKKVFVGVKLKRIREERGLTQAAFAEAAGLSASYLNQLEKNQRPLTVPVLLRINAAFSADLQLLSDGDEARLIADLKEVFSDPANGEIVAMAEIREIASSMPAAGRAILAVHRRLRHATERADAMAHELGLGTAGLTALAPMPFEQVRDFFYRHHNHFAELDKAAEQLFEDAGLSEGEVAEGLARWLEQRHGIRVSVIGLNKDAAKCQANRAYNPRERVLRLSARLDQGQRAFQMATQIAFLEMEEPLKRLSAEAAAGSRATQALARIGLANYFAGALLMPYSIFLAAAEAVRYDIDLLAQRFGVGFETVSHRLSSLQRPRPGASGVPFFIRVDRAGNISKRQSATDFHFSRAGGTCPLWNVYEAFAQPGRTVTQVAQMPDGRTYLWIARVVQHATGGFGDPGKTFAIGLGCDIRYASRLVYSKGLDLDSPDTATPIGAGCKVCERPACPQRAFPMIGRLLAVDENCSTFLPYAALPG